jgi:hypothetical protein
MYLIEAFDSNGELASKGVVPAEKLRKAKRLFQDEGWLVQVTPILDEADSGVIGLQTSSSAGEEDPQASEDL